jgi:hypothetical protein
MYTTEHAPEKMFVWSPFNISLKIRKQVRAVDLAIPRRFHASRR